jgi:hypothetical protein
VNPTPPMPSYQSLQTENPDQFKELVDFIASLKKDMEEGGSGTRQE